MSYIIIYKHWLPYAKMSDHRGFISQRYGTGGHTGVDSIGNQLSNPVCAVRSGTVTDARWDAAYGNIVEYASGNVVIRYCHLASRKVKVGDPVTAGQTIVGIEGATGSLVRKGAKHLHTMLWIDGKRVDPEPYLCGAKALPEQNTSIGGITMVRKVTSKVLNLRTGAGTGNKSYGYIPLNSLLNVTETKTVSGATWGKVTVALADGKAYTGWCNLGSTWSSAYTGALSSDAEAVALRAKIAAAKAALEG